MHVNEMAEKVHAIGIEKGWFEKHRTIGDFIALMHSELSEALEEYRADPDILDFSIINRRGKPEGFWVELADCVIRIADLFAYYDVDMNAVIRAKIEYNKTRPHRHGGKAI